MKTGEILKALFSFTSIHRQPAQARKAGPPVVEAGARRFALTLGRATELALLCRHALWSQDNEGDVRATNAARRFGASGIDLLTAADL